MTFQDELERDRRRKSDDDASPSAPGGAGGGGRKPRARKAQKTEVGDALRSVYQRAVSEDIPPEMLDLLGKLG